MEGGEGGNAGTCTVQCTVFVGSEGGENKTTTGGIVLFIARLLSRLFVSFALASINVLIL